MRGLTGVASADFFLQQAASVDGAAGPEGGGTSWGTWKDQGPHFLGSTTTFSDAFFPGFTVDVSSEILFPGLLSFLLNFSDFSPGDFSDHSVLISGLKSDGSIIGVSASQGTVSTDGNSVLWIGSGGALADNPEVKILIEQIPAPGVLALVGIAGLAATRRRRA